MIRLLICHAVLEVIGIVVDPGDGHRSGNYNVIIQFLFHGDKG